MSQKTGVTASVYRNTFNLPRIDRWLNITEGKIIHVHYSKIEQLHGYITNVSETPCPGMRWKEVLLSKS